MSLFLAFIGSVQTTQSVVLRAARDQRVLVWVGFFGVFFTPGYPMAKSTAAHVGAACTAQNQSRVGWSLTLAAGKAPCGRIAAATALAGSQDPGEGFWGQSSAGPSLPYPTWRNLSCDRLRMSLGNACAN